MTVEVTEEEYLTGFLRLFHHELCMIIDRIQFSTGPNPLSVKVLPNQRTSVIADDNAIRIQHGYDFEDIRVSQVLSFVIVANQELNNALHHPGSVALTWMNSCCENNRLSNCDLFRDTRKISNNKHINIIPRKTLTKHSFPNFILILKCTGFVHELAQVCVTVWVAMSEINSVVIMFCRVLESETVIVLTITVIAWLNSRAGSVSD